MVGDAVILKDDGLQRNEWRLARVTNVHQREGGDVRSVVVQTSTCNTYTRPITKIVLLVEAQVVESKKWSNPRQGVKQLYSTASANV